MAEYGYDPEGFRVIRRARGETTHYVFEGTEPVFEKNITTGEQRSYVFALGKYLARVDGMIGDPEAAVYYMHTDHLGSIRAVTDEAGTVVWSADYLAFGTRFGETVDASFEQWKGFTGKEYDPDTGLYYFNARWYDQEIGRFISEDPIKHGLNWYTYARNNPLRFVDPTGLSEIPASFEYTAAPGSGFYAAARHIMEHSGRQWLVDRVKEDPNSDLVKEIAQGMQLSFEMQGMSLQAGQTYALGDVGTYVPRLALNNNTSASQNVVTQNTEFEIVDKFLPRTRYGTLRKKENIKSIVVHQTGGTTAEGAIETFKSTGSAHYLIDKDGTIMRLMPDLNTAAHVGRPTTWVTNANSIGIEYVGYYDEIKGQREVIYHDVTSQQQAAGQWLMRMLMAEYSIPREHIFRHPDVSRKMRTEAQSVEIP